MVITNRMIRMKEVQMKVGISRSMIYVLMGKGAFPASVKYSERIVVWAEEEVDAWIMARRHPVASDCCSTKSRSTKAKYMRAYSEAA